MSRRVRVNLSGPMRNGPLTAYAPQGTRIGSMEQFGSPIDPCRRNDATTIEELGLLSVCVAFLASTLDQAEIFGDRPVSILLSCSQ